MSKADKPNEADNNILDINEREIGFTIKEKSGNVYLKGTLEGFDGVFPFGVYKKLLEGAEIINGEIILTIKGYNYTYRLDSNGVMEHRPIDIRREEE